MSSQGSPPRLFVFLWALLLCGCGPAAPAKAPTARVDVANVKPPAGVTLEQACTPTGPELCFNAVDDNCNGVIDEGCGVATGLLQFVIAWPAAAADVNLEVCAPSGECIPPHHGATLPGGFHLDRDCPSDEGCRGQNEEDVSFDGLAPPRGHYEVTLRLVDPHGESTPVRVRFGARLGDRIVGFDVDLSPGDDAKKTLSFDVP